MPLRLSRQLLLDQWNKAIAFVSSTLDARLATGNAHAGGVHTKQSRLGPHYADLHIVCSSVYRPGLKHMHVMHSKRARARPDAVTTM